MNAEVRNEIKSFIRTEVARKTFPQISSNKDEFIQFTIDSFPGKNVKIDMLHNNDNSINCSLSVDETVVDFIINRPYTKN